MFTMSWLVLAAPAVLVLAAALPAAKSEARLFATRAIAAAAASLAVAVSVAIAVAAEGRLVSPTIGAGGIGIAVYADALSAFMLALVSFVGLVVVRFSRNYLAGDAGHVRFTRLLLLTLAAVLTLMVSGNLAMFIAAWIATSAGLHCLLLFYGHRPAAQLAAKKKFIASRVGDACLVVGALIIWAKLGTLDFLIVFDRLRTFGAGEAQAALTIVAVLFAVTALLKSAQLPLHGWLIEVMETPTPVSALLHAGIINAGGFLVLRMSDVMSEAVPALELLAIVGGATALFGSAVMLTQPSIKAQLAYSTVAQMGFMLLQCGLGAFSSALLHIVAHSLYKAHAFLSSGSVIDLARTSWSPSPGGQPHPARLALALVGVVGATGLAAAVLGFKPVDNPGVLTLGAIVLMGIVHLLANAIDERPNAYVLAKCGVLAGTVVTAYVALQVAAERLVAGSLPGHLPLRGPLDLAIIVLVLGSFAALTVLQNVMARNPGHPFWRSAWVHLFHGLYLNTIANRVVLKVWPARLAAPAPANLQPSH